MLVKDRCADRRGALLPLGRHTANVPPAGRLTLRARGADWARPRRRAPHARARDSTSRSSIARAGPRPSRPWPLHSGFHPTCSGYSVRNR